MIILWTNQKRYTANIISEYYRTSFGILPNRFRNSTDSVSVYWVSVLIMQVHIGVAEICIQRSLDLCANSRWRSEKVLQENRLPIDEKRIGV